MPRYRKVSPAMWRDRKFRSLSGPQPNAQTLWIYLLTGVHTTRVPGIVVAGSSEIAALLGWDPLQTSEAFDQLSNARMAIHDWDADLVWLPNAVRYQHPENQNQIIGWADEWAELPKCRLLDRAYAAICRQLRHLDVVSPNDKFHRASVFGARWDAVRQAFRNGSVTATQGLRNGRGAVSNSGAGAGAGETRGGGEHSTPPDARVECSADPQAGSSDPERAASGAAPPPRNGPPDPPEPDRTSDPSPDRNGAATPAASTDAEPPADPDDFGICWNELTSEPIKRAVLPFGVDRQKRIRRLQRDPEFQRRFPAVCRKVQASAFCRGERGANPRPVSFQWLVASTDMWRRVLEGEFDDPPGASTAKPEWTPPPHEPEHAYLVDIILRGDPRPDDLSPSALRAWKLLVEHWQLNT